MKRCVFSVVALFILGLAGCVRVTRPPADLTYSEVPLYAWEALKQQRSFGFDYYLASNPMQFEVAGRGSVVLPDALRFRGTWKLGEEERALNLAAAGDFQLNKEGAEWVPHPKSEEGKILEQADRVIRQALIRRKGKGFELIEETNKTLSYSFKPNLAYLDVGFKKKFTGELVVDRRTLLAREILAQSEDGDIQFRFAVGKINRRRKIRIPFSENFRLTYNLAWGRLGKAKSTLKRRLDDAGRPSRMQIRNGNLQVGVTFPVDKLTARMLGEPGELVILGLNLEGVGPQINTRGELSDIFHVADTVAVPHVKSAEVAFDSLSRPVLELVLAKSEPSSRSFDYLGLAVDGALYEVLAVDNPTDLIRIANVTTYAEAVALGIKLRKPFRGQLLFVGQERLR